MRTLVFVSPVLSIRARGYRPLVALMEKMPNKSGCSTLLIMSQIYSKISLSIIFCLILTGCGGTRVALPIGLDEAVNGVPESGIFSEDDFIRWEMSNPSRQRLLVEHRDPDAFIKQEQAHTVASLYVSQRTE